MSLLATVNARGVFASRPAAATANEGYNYFSTDTGVLYRSNGSSWDVNSSGFTNPMTTSQDIIVGGASGAPGRLAKGADGTFLGVVAGALAYATPAGGGSGNAVACRAYNSTNQSIPNNTPTLCTFDSEDTDTDAIHSTSVNTGRLTIPASLGGKWWIDFEGYWNNAAGTVQIIYFYKNGSEVSPKTRRRIDQTASGTSTPHMKRSALLTLAAGDYIEVYVLQNKGSANDLGTVDYETTFSCFRIGA